MPNPSQLAPLPDHRNVHTAKWQELWRRHAHITTPLRQRGLTCDIAFGLSTYVVHVDLPDDSHLIIAPPQDPPCRRPPGDPQGWSVTRHRPHDPNPGEMIYDSTPPTDRGIPERPEARHGGSARHMIEAVDQHLTQLRLIPSPAPSGQAQPVAQPGPTTPTDPEGRYVYGRQILALTDQLNATDSYEQAAELTDQVLEPTDRLLERLAEFFEAAAEKAQESDHDDGFDLRNDLQDAATALRELGEDLHVAADRMRALAPRPPAHQITKATAAGPSTGLPKAVPPTHGRSR
ncbi:hypothetical protein GPA10_37450 [Streptomyces sp. p1417]|uniref:Uncharacterized protein n=1 Tax=Streptomyces typhae TaxID=2681492 RepID=A0A6L6X9B9_9ACTN|nr:hypothetical protein [Streptomyces typhae]MVO90287.1 hypothetical protein [Streptomyces typhae]